jgi:transposase
LHTGRLEGINNKVKVMKRQAYGYRDQEYFILKIKAAFRGSLQLNP